MNFFYVNCKRSGAPDSRMERLLQYLITEWLTIVQAFSRVELTNYPLYHYVCGIVVWLLRARKGWTLDEDTQIR